MPLPSLTFPNTLDPATQQELEQFISLLQGYLAAEHGDHGAHTDVTADSVSATSGYYERSRTVAMGAWTTFTPVITSIGTGTVTVTATAAAKYTLIGNTMTVIVNVTFTMAGAGGGDVVIKFPMPGGLSTNAVDVGYARIVDVGAATDGIGVAFAQADAFVYVAKVPAVALTDGVGNTLQLSFTCEVVGA